MFGPREGLAGSGSVVFGRARPLAPATPAPVSAPGTPSEQARAPVRPMSSRPPSPPRFPGLARRWADLCRRVEHWSRAHDLTPDLAEDIGSARWFRGLGTMLGLACAALLFWPSFAPLSAAPLVPLDDTARAEFRAQAIRPFAAGAGNGRHFAATDAVIRLDSAPERPVIQLAATLGESDTLGRMLQRAGVAMGDADRVAALVADAAGTAAIAPGTRFDITLGPRTGPSEPRPLQAIGFRPRFDLALAIRREGAGLVLAKMPIAVDSSPLRIRGIVGTSLYRSARAAGAPPSTVQDYLRTIDQYLAFEDIAPTDEFDLVFTDRRTADGQSQPGDLIYAGVTRDGKPRVQLLRWGPDGGFLSLDGMTGGESSDSAMLGAPVAGRITSGYGLRRHPILGFTRMHAGIDFGAAWGSPVYAVTDGTVSYAGWHGGHGNYVRLEHGGGIGTGYGHMSRIAVSPGMQVRRGQVIGYVGSSGLSTGPHLHYELYRNGQTVDPMSVRFVVHRQAVDAGQLAAYKARLRQVLALKPGLSRAH